MKRKYVLAFILATTFVIGMNNSIGNSESINNALTLSDPLNVASYAINTFFGAYAAQQTPEESDMLFPDNSSAGGAPIPFGSPLIILLGIVVLSTLKRHQTRGNEKQ